MKPSVTRTLVTSASPEQVYAYLADFTNAEEWDPGTQSCVLAEGDGGVGSKYHNVSVFLGRKSEIEYTAEELQRPTRVRLVGRNEQFEGLDLLDIKAHPDGSEVQYHAEFDFKGASKLAAPVVAAYLPFLAKKTMRQLQRSLDGLTDSQPKS